MQDPGIDDLTENEAAKIESLAIRYRGDPGSSLSELSHDFPEWDSRYPDRQANTSNRMYWEDAIAVQNSSELLPYIRRQVDTFEFQD